MKADVTIYTDGACEPNPGRGGYAAIVLRGKERITLTGGFEHTTNNRMEIYAALNALQWLNAPSRVTIWCDNKYVVNTMAKGWARKWRSQGWVTSGFNGGKPQPAKNADLWAEMLDECERHSVIFRWLKGHAGNQYNEMADALSYEEARKSGHPVDEGYMRSIRSPAEIELEEQFQLALALN